ncbi:phosphoglycerol transferase [Bifidobacterium dolichotidis]|uniref:Phosphoglycerol transferase n=2 Tax=Bifidobacterium dolichotidis TaxID=2306976 RepID=A0A430FKH6_9BIFI|nr:phosphoglycerol transferase [Bifidobacterium dolichotidis]
MVDTDRFQFPPIDDDAPQTPQSNSAGTVDMVNSQTADNAKSDSVNMSADTSVETSTNTSDNTSTTASSNQAAHKIAEEKHSGHRMQNNHGAHQGKKKYFHIATPEWWTKFKESKFYSIWEKRIKFSYGAYAVVFFLVLSQMDALQQWGTALDQSYDPHSDLSLWQQIFESTYTYLSSVAGWLNGFALALIYLVLLFIINRFWIATGVFVTLMTVFGIANKIKISLRNEPIIPSDFMFLSGGQGESITSFISGDLEALVHAAVAYVIWFFIICIALQFIDKRRAFIYCSWRHPLRNVKNIVGTASRILAAILSVVFLLNYSFGVANTESGTYEFLTENFGYAPKPWNTYEDAQANGTITTFLSLTKIRAMEKPNQYNKQAMQAIAKKYQQQADQINAERSTKLTDNTVIAVLSESFSDPTRVPGISFSEDPIPFIRDLKNNTTSGLMLSSGYGGGTANLEFQELSGLSMALFDPSLLSPYQQLIPKLPGLYTFNQAWNQACGSKDCSVAFHPYQKNFYLRDSNYKKFGFSKFETLDTDPAVTHQDKLEKSIYVSDAAAYANVLDEVRSNDRNQFVQLITMQNHTPYTTQYDPGTNQFVGANTSPDLDEHERKAISAYAKGLNYTDQETQQFLSQLDAVDKPITVIFYGDHLPGLYSTAHKDPNNELALHETDYFIWSNAKSRELNPHLNDQMNQYSASNYFLAQSATHLNAKVSPYLALLTQTHEAIPAMARITPTNGTWAPGDTVTVVDHEGKLIPENQLNDHAKELLHDYMLIQYDMTVGDHYLDDMKFTAMPQ